MYCSTCGAETTEGLKYCKRCGANIASSDATAPAKFPLALTITGMLVIALIVIVGLTIPLAASMDLIHSGFSPRDVIAIFMFSGTATILIASLLIWLLLRLIKMYQQSGGPAQAKEAREVGQALPRRPAPVQIPSPPASVTSVTEHTTRNFEPLEKITLPREAGRDTQ
jgi:hypothetical protein